MAAEGKQKLLLSTPLGSGDEAEEGETEEATSIQRQEQARLGGMRNPRVKTPKHNKTYE